MKYWAVTSFLYRGDQLVHVKHTQLIVDVPESLPEGLHSFCSCSDLDSQIVGMLITEGAMLQQILSHVRRLFHPVEFFTWQKMVTS